MKKKIEDFVKGCETCAKNSEIKKPKDIISIKSVNFLDLWEIDVIGPLPKCYNNKFIVTLIDHYTRVAYAEAVVQKDANSILEVLKNAIILYGVPKNILTENGLEFTNQLFNDFCKQKNINHKLSSPYHPQTTGSIERFNKTLMNKLRKITENGKVAWSKYLLNAVKSYNLNLSRPLGLSPYEFLYKKIPVFEIDKELNEKLKNNFILSKHDKIKTAEETLRRYKKSYGSAETKRNKFNINDQVIYCNRAKQPDKLGTKWDFKGLIVTADKSSYIVRLENGKVIRANEGNLKLFENQKQKGRSAGVGDVVTSLGI